MTDPIKNDPLLVEEITSGIEAKINALQADTRAATGSKSNLYGVTKAVSANNRDFTQAALQESALVAFLEKMKLVSKSFNSFDENQANTTFGGE